MGAVSGPGWYPVNEGRQLRYFDGQQWAGDAVTNPDAHTPARHSAWYTIGFVTLLTVLVVVWVGFEVLLGG